MKNIYVGLIGFGTIGTGVVKLLQDSGHLVEKRLGARIVLKKIADIDTTSTRPVTVEKGLLIRDAKTLKSPLSLNSSGGMSPHVPMF